jgi:tetratricopeptide (TPR) repeat protein
MMYSLPATGIVSVTNTWQGAFTGNCGSLKYPGGIRLYEELLPHDPTMRFYLADAYNSSSIAAIYDGDPSSAVEYCKKALDIYQDRKNANTVYINLAVAYLFDGQYENAMQIIDQKGDIAINELIVTAFKPINYSFNSTVKDDIKVLLEQLKKNKIWCEAAEKALVRMETNEDRIER